MLLLADDLLLMLLLTLLGRATGTETSATGTEWLGVSPCFGRMEEVEQEDTWTGVLEVGVETWQGGG